MHKFLPNIRQKIIFRIHTWGFEPGVITKIFDPFFTTKDAGNGSGLGLFITHEIIEEHGGSIKVKSARGQGTSFLIQLP